MNETGQKFQNCTAKFPWEADPDDSPQEIASQKEQFQCPTCGWLAELRRNQCMVCDYSDPLKSMGGGGRNQ